MLDIEFGNRLADLRLTRSERLGRKLTQRHVTEELRKLGLGIKPGTYASWEAGRTMPKSRDLPIIAKFFGVSVDYLLGCAEGVQPKRVSYESRTGLRWALRRSPETEGEKKGVEVWRHLANGRVPEDVMVDQGFDSSTQLTRCLYDAIYAELIEFNTEHLPFDGDLSKRVQQHFNQLDNVKLMDVWVLRTPFKATSARFAPLVSSLKTILLGEAARRYLVELRRRDTTPILKIGIAGGYSVSRLVYSLRRGDCRGLEIYPIAISPVIETVTLDANTLVGTLAYRQVGYGIRGHALQYADLQDLTHPENPLRFAPTMRILTNAKSVDVVFMGLGSLNRRRFPINWLTDLLSIQGLSIDKILKENAIGDILYHLIDCEGNEVSEEINNLICSITLADLQALAQMGNRVVAIAEGKHKADVARVAIESQYVNVLIINDELAQALLQPGQRCD